MTNLGQSGMLSSDMLSEPQRRFIEGRRIGHLATADRSAMPHVVPVCFGLAGRSLYITIDRKPKQPSARPLKRLANIADNPQASIVFDHYDEDWRRLAWVMLRGPAAILADGEEHAMAQALLQGRYVQLAAMALDGLPVIALRIAHVASWGDLG